MKRKLFNTALLLGVAMALTGCGSKQETSEERTVKVGVVRPDSTLHASAYSYVGSLEEDTKVNASFKVQGTVTQVRANEGQYVAKGSVLAVLDKNSLQQNYNAYEAAYKQAEDAYNRMKMIYDNQSLPEIKFVEAKTALDRAEANLKVAKENLEDAVLLCPIDGVIGTRSVEPGENVMPGQSLFSILDVRTVKAVVAVPENEIPSLHTGDVAEVEVPVLGGRKFTGTITEKSIDGNKLTHAYDVKIRLDNKDRSLMPGMVCNVSVAHEGTPKMVLPNNSVQITNDGRRFVWCVKEGRATAAYVTVGDLTENGVCIEDGLPEGAVVITSGMHKVSEGMKVEVK